MNRSTRQDDVFLQIFFGYKLYPMKIIMGISNRVQIWVVNKLHETHEDLPLDTVLLTSNSTFLLFLFFCTCTKITNFNY